MRINSKDLGLKSGQMAATIMDNIWMVKSMERALSHGRMAPLIADNGSIIKCTVAASLCFQMGEGMKVSTKTTENMVVEYSHMQMGEEKRESGKMGNKLERWACIEEIRMAQEISQAFF